MDRSQAIALGRAVPSRYPENVLLLEAALVGLLVKIYSFVLLSSGLGGRHMSQASHERCTDYILASDDHNGVLLSCKAHKLVIYHSGV